jgi:hypothetical protein
MLGRLTSLLLLAGIAALVAVSPSQSRHQDGLCFGSAATITGAGTIQGTPGDDVIVGSDRNDIIHGAQGNDKICGGVGDDKIGGGPEDDQLDGGPGNDDLDGGPGNDTLLGGEGDDTMECGPDNDTADGGAGANTAATTGFEACETVTNANPPATQPAPTPHRLKATLTVGQEVPHPKGTLGATGLFSATLTPAETGATIVWRLTFTRLSGTAVAAHIHTGMRGHAGPIVVTLCRPCRPAAHGTVQVKGQPARRAILNGQAYVDVHTKNNPRGEIRGQIAKLGSTSP